MSAPTIDDFLNYFIAETDSHVARLVHPDSVREILEHYTAWLQRGRGEAPVDLLLSRLKYWQEKKMALDAVRPNFTPDQLRELEAAEARLLAFDVAEAAASLPSAAGAPDPFARLPKSANWADRGSVATDPRAVESARKFLDHPWSVVPRQDGGIQLERHDSDCDIEVEFAADGSFDGIYAEDAKAAGGRPHPDALDLIGERCGSMRPSDVSITLAAAALPSAQEGKQMIEGIADALSRSDEEVGPACMFVVVPPTIATDEAFREPYVQGYRHALADVRRHLAALRSAPADEIKRDELIGNAKEYEIEHPLVSPSVAFMAGVDCAIDCDAKAAKK